MQTLVKRLFLGMEGGANQWGSTIAAHMPTLHLLAKNSQGPIVECGVGFGFSTISLISGAIESAQKMVSYDNQPGTIDNVLSAAGVKAGSQEERSLLECWKFVTKDSVEAASEWPDGSVGLLYLDTSHDLGHTRRELSSWLPKMKPEGIMCGHDYLLHEDPRTPWAGVKAAVDEFAELHKNRFRLQIMKPDMGFFVLWPTC